MKQSLTPQTKTAANEPTNMSSQNSPKEVRLSSQEFIPGSGRHCHFFFQLLVCFFFLILIKFLRNQQSPPPDTMYNIHFQWAEKHFQRTVFEKHSKISGCLERVKTLWEMHLKQATRTWRKKANPGKSTDDPQMDGGKDGQNSVFEIRANPPFLIQKWGNWGTEHDIPLPMSDGHQEERHLTWWTTSSGKHKFFLSWLARHRC